MRTSTRRLGAVALATALVTGTALSATPAQAANSYGSSAAGWLSAQLTDGVVHNDQFGFDDYGLSLDVFFALKALDTRPAAAASVLDRLDDDPSAYIEFGGQTFAGSVGKLATAVELQGRDPRAFGGVDLVQRLEQRVHTAAGAEQGRATDGPGDDFSNTIGQSFVVRGLTGARSPLADEATTFLLKQQCAAGFFREGLTSTGGSYACDGGTATERTPSVDATGFAIQALTAAEADGVTGLDDDITAAADWLVTQQQASGAFEGNGTPNTNTTGLAATALVLAGRPNAAERAAVWIARRAVTDQLRSNNPALRAELGAVAYDDQALAAGKRDGIPTELRDQWRRATAQAAIGVNAVRTLRVTAPVSYVHGGSTMTVRASGLRAGEGTWFDLGGAGDVKVTATADGRASARLALPRRTRSYVVHALGSSSERTGDTTVSVLAAKTLPVSLRSRSVRQGRYQQVTVTGLARSEPVRLNYRGQRIWNGRASTTGRVVHSFKVGRAVGTQRLRVLGKFDDRTALTSFRVVR